MSEHQYHIRAEFDRKQSDANSMTVPAVLSTETPVQRQGFSEILSHKPGAVDLSRFPLPTIESHNTGLVNVAVAENPVIQGGKLRATIRFGSSQRAQELFADVQAGIVTGLSIGYQWIEYQESGSDITVTRWLPHEVSIVSVPADNTAGFFRSQERVKSMQTQTTQPTHQPEPEPINNDPVMDFKRQEQERRNEIRSMLAPFAGRHPEVVQRALDDMSITPAQASGMMLKACGENLRPTVSYRSMDELNQPISHSTSGGEMADAIIDGLLMRSGIKVQNQHPAARDFSSMSLGEISRIMLRKRHGLAPSGLSQAELITRAMSTSDLPYLLENVANKALLIGFESTEQSHDKFCYFTTVNDFKTQSRVAMSAFESLSEVPELGEVTYSSLINSRETYKISTYQKAIAFSRQALINDDLGDLTVVPQKLGMAARRTECDLVYSIFNSNPLMADNTELFHATRGNLLTGSASAFKSTSLESAITALRKAKDIGNHGYLGIRPQWLIVPPELEFTALALLAVVSNTKASATAIPNSDMAKVEVIVEPRLIDPNSWYLLGSGVETIEVGRLDSSDGNGISFVSDNDFSTDAYRMKIRLEAGAKALSPSGMVKSAGA